MTPFPLAAVLSCRVVATTLVLLVALAAVLLGWHAGSKHWRNQYQQAATRHAQLVGELAAQAKVAAAAAKAARAAYQREEKARDEAYKQAVEDAYERGKAVGRAVAAGDRRLRRDWDVRRCPAPAGDAAAAAEDDADALGRRAVAVGRVLGKAGEWDATYRRTYETLIATRRLLAQCYGVPPE